MFGSLPGNIYILRMDRDDLPPEKFEKIITPFFAWSDILREYFFEDTGSSFDIRMTPQDPYRPVHHRGAENTQAKKELERMLRRGDAVKISDRPSRGVGECFYINDEGKLICTDPYAFDSSGSESIIRAYQRSISRREHIYRGGKPRATQFLFSTGYYPPAKESPKPVSSSAAALAGVMAAGESTTLRGAVGAIASRIPQANPVAAAASVLFYSGEVGKGSDVIPPEYQQSYRDDKIKGPNLGATAKELGGAYGSPGGWGPEDEIEARKFDRFSKSDLKNAANKPINEQGLSAAARAWDKHAGRPGGAFEPLRGDVFQKNETAKRFIDKVLDTPDSVKTNLSRGGVEYRLPDGRGIRYNNDGSFSGLLDPKRIR